MKWTIIDREDQSTKFVFRLFSPLKKELEKIGQKKNLNGLLLVFFCFIYHPH